ncbi:MAG: hypothetical protein FWC84_08390 [Alphaproteobacteria bacterium]|nr:hypothetical protein [Alphaproteobacteria bacterium]
MVHPEKSLFGKPLAAPQKPLNYRTGAAGAEFSPSSQPLVWRPDPIF